MCAFKGPKPKPAPPPPPPPPPPEEPPSNPVFDDAKLSDERASDSRLRRKEGREALTIDLQTASNAGEGIQGPRG